MIGDAKRFLAALFATATTGFLELRLITPRRTGAASKHFEIGQWEEAAEAAQKLAPHREVYFGVVLRATRRRRNVDDDALATAVWADIDNEAAAAAMAVFELPPSITVKSGTGGNLHAYWLLEEAVPINEVVRVNRALAARLGADPKSIDASRILRVPGTVNQKHDPPTPVRLASLDAQRRYDIADIRRVLGITAIHPATVAPPHRVDPAPSASPPVMRVLAKLDAVRETSDRKWSACCPAHDDQHPSLSVTEGDDGRCLLHCHAGCEPDSVAAAIGLPMSALFADAVGSGRSRSEATRLVDLTTDQRVELFHDPFGAAFASLVRDGHRETMALGSPAFGEWLQRLFFREHRKVPGSQSTADALATLRGMARFEGEEEQVWTRVGQQDDTIWLDLGNDDWRAVAITASGWEIVTEPGVRFHRPDAARALPVPVRGGSLESLRALINVADEDWPLVKGWLVCALMPVGPFPLLVFNGEQGTAKSTSADLVRSVIDPVSAGRRSMPKSERDLAITASNGWCLLFDNVTKLSAEQSNVLCRLSTGGGFATRELYTDRSEVYFDLLRPVLMTGIDIAGVGEDLRERSITLELPTISTRLRREERQLIAEFQVDLPAMLGAVLDAVSCALRRRHEVVLPDRPRMADAATIMTAAEPALDLADGTVVSAFIENQRDSSSARLGEDPVARTMMSFLATAERFSGTHTELMSALLTSLPSDVEPGDLPRNPQQLSRRLKQIAPALRLAGYQVRYPRRGERGARLIDLRDARDARDAS